MKNTVNEGRSKHQGFKETKPSSTKVLDLDQVGQDWNDYRAMQRQIIAEERKQNAEKA
ncbi:hypothetical protein [Acaryochloris thomasi]|nr:hypothetical protein [Acaryochloris thomasi]